LKSVVADNQLLREKNVRLENGLWVVKIHRPAFFNSFRQAFLRLIGKFRLHLHARA